MDNGVFFKQSNRNSKVISETDCIVLVVNDQSKKLSTLIESIWTTKMNNTMKAIDNCFGFSDD